MIFDDYEDVSDDTITKPEGPIWEIDDRYALIAFLLMSIDKKPDAIDIKKLDVFMGIKTGEEFDNTEENKKLKSLQKSVIRECSVFLNGLERDETYCDCIKDEIDNIIEGDENCNIGEGYSKGWLNGKPCELLGGPQFIFDYLKIIINEGVCNDNQKLILKYLARKWKVDKSVLFILENCTLSLDKINQQRIDIEKGDLSHSEAKSVLFNLEKEEKEIWNKLSDLGISNERAIDTENYNIGKNLVSSFMSSVNDEDKEDNRSAVDNAGDAIVEGIYKIGDIICAPFNWLTEKITGMM